MSGKGGTGKTSLTAAVSMLLDSKVLVDCDVDAADLHLLLKPTIRKEFPFYGGKLASINEKKCIQCGRCVDVCRFNAITSDLKVISRFCEGCSACFYQCPNQAIEMLPKLTGVWYESETRGGTMVHARLNIAEDNSGKLVYEVKNYARKLANEQSIDLILVDGPPGIGCPAISSVTGSDFVVLVTEPTISAFHDVERLVGLVEHFHIPMGACINKCNVNSEIAVLMKEYFSQKGIAILAEIPYDRIFNESQLKGLTLIEMGNKDFPKLITDFWEKIKRQLIGKD